MTNTRRHSHGQPERNIRSRRRSRWTIVGSVLLVLAILLVAARLAMPTVLRWYVNRTLDQNQLYEGEIGKLSVNLWRGAYTLEDVRMLKRTGNTSVPFFYSKRVDLALEWDALRHGRLVGEVVMDQPELNFVQAANDSNSQNGDGGPWLDMIKQLFPFKINRTLIHKGAIHFHAPDRDPPVDVYLRQVEATIENLGNVQDELSPLFATVKAEGLAMGHSKCQFEMKLNPFSYYPTFQLAVRLVGLDVTKLNELAEAYGDFNFKAGWFDLVVELNAREGRLNGYVKPLFRNIQVFSLQKDIAQGNVLQFFWQALLGATTTLLKNQPRDQFGTVVPLSGDLEDPRKDILAAIGNVLRNAFIRAYLPRLQGGAPDINQLHFGTGESITEPLSTDGG